MINFSRNQIRTTNLSKNQRTKSQSDCQLVARGSLCSQNLGKMWIRVTELAVLVLWAEHVSGGGGGGLHKGESCANSWHHEGALLTGPFVQCTPKKTFCNFALLVSRPLPVICQRMMSMVIDGSCECTCVRDPSIDSAKEVCSRLMKKPSPSKRNTLWSEEQISAAEQIAM